MEAVKRYAAMKDSGVEWIGMIPTHWDLSRIKYCSTCNDEALSENEPYNLPIRYVDISSVSLEKGVHHIEDYLFENAPSRARRIVRKGDVIVSTVRTYLKAIATIKADGLVVSTGFCVLRSNLNTNSKFLEYYCKSDAFTECISANSTGISYPAITSLNLINTYIPKPSIYEQRDIASFLDEKCSAIDDIIASARASIDDYKQIKASTIYEAVTKGLNPDVEMKESGVDIIGEMPAHWATRRQRFLCQTATGNQDTQNSIEDGQYPFYVRSPIVERSNTYTFDGEGILMAGDGVGAGKVFHHAFGKYAVHQRVYRFYNFNDIFPRYFFFYISNLFSTEIDKGSAKSTVASVRLPMLSNFLFCLPPLHEQQAIADYLDTRCAEIDSLIAEKEALIADLEAYKKSLIYECVTGKRRVTEDSHAP